MIYIAELKREIQSLSSGNNLMGLPVPKTIKISELEVYSKGFRTEQGCMEVNVIAIYIYLLKGIDLLWLVSAQ